MNATMTEYSLLGERILESPIDSTTSLLEKINRDVINFALGSPAQNMIPTQAFAEIGNTVLNDASAYGYAPTEGDSELVSSLVSFLKSQGRNLDPASIVITAGGMQGLDVVCKLFINPGDTVIVESPTYPSAFMTAIGYGANIIEIPIDDDGLKVNEIDEYVNRTGDIPKMIYVVPTFQNPTGRTLSLQRREELAGLARKLNCLIVEDDPYGLIGFTNDHIPSIRDISHADSHVVTVRTFSKIMAPGLRVGWLEVDPAYTDKIIAARQCMDTCANTVSQRIVAGYLDSGKVQNHLRYLCSQYEVRKNTLRAAVETAFLGTVHTSDPLGGFFLWVTFPEETDCELLFKEGLERGVAIVPGNAFSPSRQLRNCARLCFAALDPDAIGEGVRRLAEAYYAVDAVRAKVDVA
ncbi:MAG: PLP-dependent aminotransferase family protein [Bifidobacterium tibiigranuli]|jgi:2-aminoadipate transaminase|uniref:aminotransferase-like domain-containing protein n=2 Tax=Bifidobacterium tibiigranuli TaxID=2172043 RepID=UPI0026F009FD|nr:PLP-dependent aminotransferase family protein [Bifidobacterium tibiigranuli]MCI1672885.1 PLP-dependent aminotransferase family protein [Bifidobacterium tibiigranuli]